MKLLITCEHGGNEIPPAYSFAFKKQEDVLNSHRGWDLGILNVFDFVKEEANFYKASRISRLLIEKNRSIHHKDLFSAYSRTLAIDVKQKIIEQHYLPYRNEVEHEIKKFIESGEQVLHLSLHSFTPILNGEIRTTDVGFLYDPKRLEEKFWINKMIKSWKMLSTLKVRLNYPYLGTADGFTTYLRKKFPEKYSGIEIELNQSLIEKTHFSLHLKQNLKTMIQGL